MYLHDLVRTITMEVLKELQGRKDKLSFLVLGENTPETTSKVYDKLGTDVSLVFYDQIGVGEKSPARCIIPFLSCSGMAELAIGKASEPYLSAALRLLLEGKTVEVLEFEYKAYSATAPFALYNLYAAHENTLSGYGLRAYSPQPIETLRFRESLVTEQAVTEAHKNGAATIITSTQALVTPLAADTAKALNITILKQL